MVSSSLPMKHTDLTCFDDIAFENCFEKENGTAQENSSWFQVCQVFRAMIHDLKMPLAAEKIAIDMLGREMENLSGEAQELLASMQRNNHDLGNLVDLLLEVTEGAMDLPERMRFMCDEGISLQDLLNELFVRMRPLILIRNVTVECEIPENFPLLRIRPDHLRRVLINVLGNAIQHTHRGARVKVIAQDFGHCVRLLIQDNGRTVGKGFQAKPAGISVGSGLGLSVCRLLLSLYGGSIQLDSTCKEGTCFVMTLPFVGEGAEFRRAVHASDKGKDEYTDCG